MIDFFSEVQEIGNWLDAVRKELHQNPELGRKEIRTQAFLEAKLDELGIPHRRVADTGIVADIVGELPGEIRALRADMDALPITESTGASYASNHIGVMHACGHDVHMSAVLGAARLLMAHRDELRGTVRLLFQPDEENDGGAKRLLEDGALENVCCVYGAHVDPELPEDSVGIRYGKFYAASNPVSFLIHGKSAHGAQPEKGVNALYAGAVLVERLQKLPEEFQDPSVVTIGSFHAGTAGNIIADEAKLIGILRTLGSEDRARMVRRIQETVKETEDCFGVRIDTRIVDGYPGVVNTEDVCAHVEKVLQNVLPKEKRIRIDQPTLTTEDVGYLIDAVTGCFYHIGTGGEYPLHHPKFLPTMECVHFASAVHASVLFQSYRDE